ncbi:hypothetical protein D8S82_05665 [Mycobacterium hodleri]|uniref:Methyl-accepting chemotaxis sensory transducer n=1 Tax=Mycolicibacterium hodleri TaxID=49897 RepID=A0A544W682_9MYCO|nr:hypothetical protein [Mycolicibacterium hodleri]TQR87754.1 hypothetical protein D8S82_05665 [Mycolicibacterium hodleri]
MPAVGRSVGSYGRLIVTPDMEPPEAAHWDAQEQTYRSGAASWNGIHQQILTDGARFRAAADSQGFDEVHRVNAVLAEEAKTIAEWHAKVADKCADIATVIRDTRSGQEQLVRDADAKIASAKLPGEAEALVTEYHGIARYQTEAGVTAAMASHASFKKSTENTRALDLLTKWGDFPAGPPAQPVDHETSPAVDQGNGPWNTSRENGSDEKHPADAPADPTTGTSTTQPGVGPGIKTTTGDEGITKARRPATQATPGVTSPSAAPSPLSAMSSVGSMGGIGGMDSGGGVPKMPGRLVGGGMPGMGSNPLSTDVGEMFGAGTGLPNAGGVSGSGTGTGSPLSAFSQGMSTTSGVGGGMPTSLPPPPAPASPSPALSGGMHATPKSAAAGSAVSPASAQPGTVTPATPAATLTGGTGTGGVAPMMLPPGSMGPPAGAVPPPAAAVPVGAAGNTPSASLPLSGAGTGATLIPASVVAAGQTAAARERRESADAAAAKGLAWSLQHAAQAVNYPIEWAVGVFRSPSGTETVITSNDGASYIPAGVFVPRSVRVLATDPLVDDDFRQLWFGWSDPARVLVEYAQLRAELGWRLVAAATTVGVSALRDAGVEHPPSCTRQTNPLLQPGQQVAALGMDSMHVHRLSVLWPDMYPRLLRVMDARPIFQDRIVSATSASLMNSATTQAHAVDDGIPDSMRQIWSSRGGDREPTPQQWAKYDEDAKTFNTVTSICRPAFANGSTADPSDTIGELARYRAHWLVARAAEHIGGWATRPLPLVDMCYAAAAVGDTHFRELILNELASVEDDLAVRP